MATEKTYTGVTLHGLPVRIDLDFPFHRSEGGSDWYVLHGKVSLNDGGPLHADMALNLAQTVREVLPALDGDLAFWVAVNTARKTLDIKQLELLRSGKRQPVPINSRCYSMRLQQFTFATVKPEEVGEFVARKVFWASGTERQASLDCRSLRCAVSGRIRRQYGREATGCCEGSCSTRLD